MYDKINYKEKKNKSLLKKKKKNLNLLTKSNFRKIHLALLNLLLEWLTNGCSITSTLAEILEIRSLSFHSHKYPPV